MAKTAAEIIDDILQEEQDIIPVEKRVAIRERIIKQLNLSELCILNLENEDFGNSSSYNPSDKDLVSKSKE